MTPNIEPYESGMLDVGDGRQVYWECCGNPAGKPALYRVAALIAVWLATAVSAFFAGLLVDPVGPAPTAILTGNVMAAVPLPVRCGSRR